ncbi:MAG: histidine kinase dimerization/phospho-acceptor domain-containing protein, partial [Polyangiales bacterium]
MASAAGGHDVGDWTRLRIEVVVKIVHKMTLAFLAGTCAILALNGVQRVHREVAIMETNAVNNHRSLGRTLRSAVQSVWRTEGEQRALELVDDATVQHGRVRFRWVWLDQSPVLHVDAAALRALSPTEAISAVDSDDAAAPMRYTYVLATTQSGRPAALELSEPLVRELADVRKAILESTVKTAVLVLVCALLAMTLGTLLVGQPVRKLVDKARRIGAGNFTGPVVVHTNDELGELAREMNATCERLAAARDQLRHADRLSTVGKLASGIAHELGTPLNVISGHAAMIATREAQGDEAIESAHVITQASDRMATIIRQLLDFARRRGPQRARDDLTAIVRQTVALLRTIAHKQNVTLELTTEQPVEVEVEAGQVQQALTNLVVNAIQASPRGGRVTAELGHRRASPPADENGASVPPASYAFVSIHDEG